MLCETTPEADDTTLLKAALGLLFRIDKACAGLRLAAASCRTHLGSHEVQTDVFIRSTFLSLTLSFPLCVYLLVLSLWRLASALHPISLRCVQSPLWSDTDPFFSFLSSTLMHRLAKHPNFASYLARAANRVRCLSSLLNTVNRCEGIVVN